MKQPSKISRRIPRYLFRGINAPRRLGSSAWGATPPLIHLRLRGFDTHSDQLNRQEVLLADLAASIAALRSDLIAAGAWDSTTIATYEFGRRVAENGSAGTDHGVANTPFCLWRPY